MTVLETTVSSRVDVVAAAAAARTQARECGHSISEAHALSLVVAELAMNALRSSWRSAADNSVGGTS